MTREQWREEAERLSTEGQRRAEAGTDPALEVLLFDLIVGMTQEPEREQINTDDIWERIEARNIVLPPNFGSGLGPIIKKVAKAGYISPTKFGVEGQRPEHHKALIRVWKCEKK